MPRTDSNNTASRPEKITATELSSRMKTEILFDIQQGVVPSNVRTFSALHDYVDANGYGGLFDDECPLDVGNDEDFAITCEAQEIVHQWLKGGRK